MKAVWAVHPERAHDAAAWRIVKNCADCALLDQPNGCLLSPDGLGTTSLVWLLICVLNAAAWVVKEKKARGTGRVEGRTLNCPR